MCACVNRFQFRSKTQIIQVGGITKYEEKMTVLKRSTDTNKSDLL